MKGDGNTTVRRHAKGQRIRVNFEAPPIQHEYAQYYNALDINDRNIASYSCSIKTNSWYLRVFFWLLDMVVYCCFLIFVAAPKDEWLKYRHRREGRRKFQIDLSLAIMECGIKYDWPAPYDNNVRPEWLRQTAYVPCACGLCFFCKNGKTTCKQSKPDIGTLVTKASRMCSPERKLLGRPSKVNIAVQYYN